MEGRGAIKVGCLVLLSIAVFTQCVSSQSVKPLTKNDKAAILRAHNILRGSVSPPAANMRELVYSDQLESAVESFFGSRCSSDHTDRDERNRASSSFSSVGENIFAIAGTNLVVNYTSYIYNSWGLDEQKFYDYNKNSCVPGEQCGHYTQVIWAETTHVGCVSVNCPAEAIFQSVPLRTFRAVLFVCQYGPAGNFVMQRPYESGSSCSACPVEHPQCRANLCTRQLGVVTDSPIITTQLPTTEASTQPPPETEASTQPPPETEASTQPPPETEASTQPPPETEASTQPPPETEASTQPPPETEASTQPPPETEASTQPPPETEASTQPPPETEASTQPPPETEASTQPPPETEASTQPPPETEATTQPPPETEASTPPKTEITTPSLTPMTTTDKVILRPLLTLTEDSPRLEGSRLHFNFHFIQPMLSVMCSFDRASQIDCSTGSAVFNVDLSVFHYHILRVKAVTTDGREIVFRRAFKTGPDYLCIVNFVNGGMIQINSRQMKIEFWGTGPIKSYLCSLNRAKLSPCTSGQIYNVIRGQNRMKVVPDGCGINRRNAVMKMNVA